MVHKDASHSVVSGIPLVLGLTTRMWDVVSLCLRGLSSPYIVGVPENELAKSVD